MKNSLLLIFIFFLANSCSRHINPSVSKEDISGRLEFLASDSLKGRYPGTPEDSVLMQYLANEFRNYGLASPTVGYIQEFQILSEILPSSVNRLSSGSMEFELGTNYIPASYSSDGKVEAEVLFCGYGMEIMNDSLNWDEYGGAPASGKWSLLLRGEPGSQEVFMDQGRDRDKVMRALDKGAAGVLLVSGKEFDPKDILDMGRGKESATAIPVIQISRETANKIMGKGFSIDDAEQRIMKRGPTEPILGEHQLSADIEMIRKYSSGGNVVAVLPGIDPVLKDEWIIIGAHHDHLGYGGPGSSSRMPDTTAVHYGADDNASGVAMVMELAEAFGAGSKKPFRSLLFVTFGGEEMGLLGSKHFVNNSPVDLSKVNLMINFDMVGRLSADSILQVGGVGTSEVFRPVLEAKNESYGFRLALSEAGFGPSDHASFYSKDIPVLFFSTGAHSDYHTPFDNNQSINLQGMEDLGKYFLALTDTFASMDARLVFKEAGPKESTSRSFRGRITLGIMPDVSGDDKGGLSVLAVTQGKPAETGGMQKGDLIVAIEGKPVQNVYDYMYRLGTLKYGERIIVRVKRNGDYLDLLIQL
jgi:aminopeptidase YwaD